MKKVLMLLTVVMLLLAFDNVNASLCSYSDQAKLNSEAAKIKIKYEEKTGYNESKNCGDGSESCQIEYNYFTITILNLNENLYLDVMNNVDDTTYTFDYSDVKDGVITFDWKKIMEIATFTFKVYSSEKTECPNELYQTLYLTTPRKNPYYYYGKCSGVDYYLCEKYVTFEEIDFYEFSEEITKYKEKQAEIKKQNEERNIFEKVWDFIKENKTGFIIGGSAVLVIAAGAVTYVIIKRKKSIL